MIADSPDEVRLRVREQLMQGASQIKLTAGGGVEYAFAGNWTVKAEYLHVGFSNRSVTSPQIGLPYTFAFKDSLDIGRVGINYKF